MDGTNPRPTYSLTEAQSHSLMLAVYCRVTQTLVCTPMTPYFNINFTTQVAKLLLFINVSDSFIFVVFCALLTMHLDVCCVDHASRYMRVRKPTWCNIYLSYFKFSHYTSTCFGLAICPSSGGNNVYINSASSWLQYTHLQSCLNNKPNVSSLTDNPVCASSSPLYS
jgi:hypothetical protein